MYISAAGTPLVSHMMVQAFSLAHQCESAKKTFCDLIGDIVKSLLCHLVYVFGTVCLNIAGRTRC